MAAAAAELDLDISVMCLRCTVDNNGHFSQATDSSEFRFKGGAWKLRYEKRGKYYALSLRKCSGVSPNPLHVSVCVETSGKGGRIVKVLPQVKRYTTQFEATADFGYPVWRKTDQEIRQAVPEFSLYGVLKLLVVLKLADSDSRFWQTEWSIPEATGPSSSTRSTSVQTTLRMNVLPCTESLTKDLDQLMVDGSHYDVEFQCAGHSTKAHKALVCKRSPVFASMLSTDMAEGRTGVVNIPDISPEIFTQFMRYIYTGQLQELTFDTALRLYEAGDQYAVLALANRCSDFLLEHLSVENAYEVLVIADAHNDKEFLEKVIEFMVENRVPLVSEEWSAFCDEHSKLANKVLNGAFVKAFAKLPAPAASETLAHNPK